MPDPITVNRSYATVNGLKMYYESYGQGMPLVLIHGGGSTIDSTYGRIIPFLAPHCKLVAVELQAHGRTPDRGTPLSFAQDADDIAALLDVLAIEKADFIGFSNGGQTLIEIALRHEEKIRKMILASTFYKKEAVDPRFWDGFEGATLDMMPKALADAYLAVNNDRKGLQTMCERDVERMKAFRGWTDAEIASIKKPSLIINGNHDVAPPEHAVEMFNRIEGSQLVIFPGGHGTYLGEVECLSGGKWPKFNAVELILEFLGY